MTLYKAGAMQMLGRKLCLWIYMYQLSQLESREGGSWGCAHPIRVIMRHYILSYSTVIGVSLSKHPITLARAASVCLSSYVHSGTYLIHKIHYASAINNAWASASTYMAVTRRRACRWLWKLEVELMMWRQHTLPVEGVVVTELEVGLILHQWSSHACTCRILSVLANG